MKHLLLALTVAAVFQSVNVNASDYNPLEMSSVTTISPFISPFLTTIANGGEVGSIHKEAAQFVEDGQGYMQSGSITPFLESKMNMMRAVNPELSDEEIMDGLLDAAATILK